MALQTDSPLALEPVPPSRHPVSTAEVSEATCEALRSARAPATQRVYALHVRAFGQWLEEDVLDATPVDVANYLAGPGAEKSHSWRAQAAAAIKSAFDEVGLPSPTTHASVRRTIRGLHRQNPRTPRQAAPLTEAVIAAIEATACTRRRGRGGQLETEVQARRRGQLDIAIIRVMRDALLRRSEAAALVWADVSVEPDGSGRLRLAMPTETDQEASEPHMAYLTRATVQALTGLWSPYHTPEMRLFGLCARQISERIRAAARAAGLIDKYSGHSGRTGAAHSLAAKGATFVELQQAGRWKSPSMPAAYARSARAGRGAVARLLEQ